MDLDLSEQTRSGLKTRAAELRRRLREAGHDISHSSALEMIAKQLGHRDWNTLCAAARKPVRLAIGDRVQGRYLGHDFCGRVHALGARSGDAHLRITVHFDEPVDVVSFDSFSAHRQRVSAYVRADGMSAQKTSNGVPHLVLERSFP